MKVRSKLVGAMLVVMLVLVVYNVHAQKAVSERRDAVSEIDAGIDKHARQMLEDGRRVFRFDTFGSEAFWGETLQLHRAIAGEKNGGVGGGVSPKTVLSVGLKVDADALPTPLKRRIKDGRIDLDDPAATLVLLKLNSVVGVTGLFNDRGDLTSMALQCALCHSTVDDSFAPGFGKRRDGWANRDLNIGLIVSLAPNLTPFVDLLGVDVATVKQVLTSWGPGRFDAVLDKVHTWGTPGVVTSKLAALHFYQLAIPAPKPAAGSFDKDAAAPGHVRFNGAHRRALDPPGGGFPP